MPLSSPRSALASSLLAVALVGCGDDGSGPEPLVCDDELYQVDATVAIQGSSVVFDWEPACPMAVMIIEEDGADQWLLITDESKWEEPDSANLIYPPVTYGVAPQDIFEVTDADDLVPGRSYHFVLWRVLPLFGPIETGCIEQEGPVCLVAVELFTR